MIPENFKNEDTIFHYCKSETAIEHILLDKKIRLSSRKSSNDPIENKSFQISQALALTDDDIENRTKKESEKLTNNLSKRINTIKHACFCENNSSKKGTYEYYGFLKPRMWDQYGDYYKGVCISFSKKKLIENPIIKLAGKVNYLTYSDLQKGYLEINRNYLDQWGIRKYKSELVTYVDRLFLRKHIDYRDEREYRMCAFSQNEFEYIDIEKSINGLIVIPELMSKHIYIKLKQYSRDLQIPLLYLTLKAEGMDIIKEPNSDFLNISF